jgi:hypothetical protein
MNHIAGASLSCPPNSNNPKRQHSARGEKSSAAELFSEQVEPSSLTAHGQIAFTIGRGNEDLASRIQPPNSSRAAD